MQTKIQKQKWYSKTAEQTLELLKTGRQGLSETEASSRLEIYGPNKLPESKKTSLTKIFLRQFASPLIYVLIVSTGILFILGDAVDTITILAVLLINAIVGAIQEGKARNTFEALKKLATTEATVIRNETPILTPDTNLVPGDIIILKEGEKVPADARLIHGTDIRVDESSLTGESIPVSKDTEVVIDKPSLPLQDMSNVIFKGTYIVAGSGIAVVVATGQNTAIGGISAALVSLDREIPLQKNINHLARILILVVVGVCLAVFAYGTYTGRSTVEMVSVAVSLAVSIIPEGLPVAITLVLASGVWRMSKRNALIKKLQAVESLGQADILAVDKTGTITKNELKVSQIITLEHAFEVSGSGFDPKGEVLLDKEPVSFEDFNDLKAALHVFALCPQATRFYNTETALWEISGDPTDAALIIAAEKAGLKKEALETNHELIEEVPFDYVRKVHATVHKTEKGTWLSAVGAPEFILANSKLEKTELTKLKNIYSKLAKKGLRVLGFGYLENPKSLEQNIPELKFGGLVTLEDTLQETAPEAISLLSNAGIKTVMITGDNKLTGRAIAESAGIYKPGDLVVSGEDIAKLGSQDIEKVSVFARVTPENKMQIIQEYGKRGHTIAMTGDGVNDAPSLAAADLGIAMGVRGTEVAKETADIVLLDDNFSSIVAAVEEGRNIYKTIKKIILYLLSTSLGELGVVAAGLLLGLPLVLLPVQIIWLNFVTNGFITVAMGLEPKEPGLLSGKLSRTTKFLIDQTMVLQISLMGGAMTITGLLLFIAYYEISIIKAQTMTLTILAVIQWLNAWNVRSETKSIFRLNPFTSPWLILATLIVVFAHILAIYNPLFQKFLGTVPLTLGEWILIALLSLSIILVEELRKLGNWITRKIQN